MKDEAANTEEKKEGENAEAPKEAGGDTEMKNENK